MPHPFPPASLTAPIRLTDVTVARAGTPVLTSVSFSLAPQERLAIVGPNGAGKTTLLRTIIGLEQPQSGEIRLFGAPCQTEAQMRPARLRIGFLFQDSDDQLFCPSVLEDVSFGPLNMGLSPQEARSRAMETLEHLGMAHLAERIVTRLSGGEKRLVCLAGVLAMRPEVLLLDEPTNGVDAQNLARLSEALRRFEGAMILVSHDAQFVAGLAERALLLAEGQLQTAEIHTHAHLHSHAHIHPHQP